MIRLLRRLLDRLTRSRRRRREARAERRLWDVATRRRLIPRHPPNPRRTH